MTCDFILGKMGRFERLFAYNKVSINEHCQTHQGLIESPKIEAANGKNGMVEIR